MNDLDPTLTRLARLRAVERQLVFESYLPGDDGRSFEDTGAGRRRLVTAQMAELYRAGWVRVGGLPGDTKRPYELTAAGRDVLDEHGGVR